MYRLNTKCSPGHRLNSFMVANAFWRTCYICSGADNDLKTLMIMQIFSKEENFLILPWMYSLCIAVCKTSTFFYITGSDDVIFMSN